MKYLLFYLAFMMFGLSGHTQTWIQPGATWHYDWESVGGVGFTKLVYSKDTLFNGKQVQKISVFNYDWWFNHTRERSPHYIYRSADSIYYWNDGRFKLLYDFGAKPGDTWTLDYDPSLGCDTSTVIVDSIGTIVLNGNTYRWISMSRLTGSFWGLEGRIVERFGAMDSYFFPTFRACDTNMTDGSEIYYFTCFEDDSFPLYNPSSRSCEYWKESGIDEERFREVPLQVFPNPATDILHIKLTEPKGNYQVQIFDATGKKFTNRSMGSGEEVVDISTLPKGIFIVLVTDGQENFYSQKMVKM